MRGVCAAVLVAAALGPLAAGCARPAPLRIEDAWVRAATRNEATAAYLTLVNDGSESVVLAAASVPGASRTMMHETVREGGMVSMREAGPIEVPARSRLRFEPGGRHLMLVGLEQDLVAGRRVNLELRLADGRTLTAEARIRP